MWVFTIVWLGQLISLIGSGLTSFALGIWVYQHTGSVTQFALISLTTTLPLLVISPFAGALVDRWNHRYCMIISDSIAGVCTLVLALLIATSHLQVWHIYLITCISSIFTAFQWPAYSAATTLLVSKQHLGRASGMTQLAEAVSQLIAPVLGSALLVSLQLQGIILLDFVSFLFALITLVAVKFPQVKTSNANQEGKGSLLYEAKYGWDYITARPGLLGLLIFVATINFLTGVVNVLVTPLVLAFASVSILGIVLSVGGVGMLVGSLVMSLWGRVKYPIYSIFCFTLLGGFCILLVGMRPSIPVFLFSAFLYFFGLPIINGSSQVIWLKKVMPEVQGRVFALQRMIVWGALPLAYVVAGPLADRVFEPLLAVNGPLVGTIGKAVGVGPGYGIAFLFVVMGMLTMLVTVGGYFYPRLRLVEEELLDAITDSTV